MRGRAGWQTVLSTSAALLFVIGLVLILGGVVVQFGAGRSWEGKASRSMRD